MANGKRLGKKVKSDLVKHLDHLMGVYGFPNVVEALRATLDATAEEYPMHRQWQWALKAISQTSRSDGYEFAGRLFAKEVAGETMSEPRLGDVFDI